MVSEAMVVFSRRAELLELIEATKSVFSALENAMEDEEMVILKPEHRVRYKQDRKLLLRSGTCETLKNSTALASFPSTMC